MTSDDQATARQPSRRRRAATGGPDSGLTGLTGPADAAVPAPAVAEDGAAILAEHVDVRMGAVGRVDSDRLEVIQGAIGGVRAGSVSVKQGAIGGTLAGEVSIRQSFARSILAREARVEQSFVRTIVAAEVRVERATFVGLLLARRVAGDVRVLLDWRGALAFGAAFGLLAGLVGRGRRKPD